MLREHYLREQLKSFKNFDSTWRKEAWTVCSWCLAERLTATLPCSFHTVWIHSTSRAATAVAELGKRLKLHWCFDEKVSWLVPLSKSLLSPQSQLCNIFKTAIFAYFWNVKRKRIKRISVYFLNKKEPKLIKMVVCLFLGSSLVATHSGSLEKGRGVCTKYLKPRVHVDKQ